jgi:hypothetical protein
MQLPAGLLRPLLPQLRLPRLHPSLVLPQRVHAFGVQQLLGLCLDHPHGLQELGLGLLDGLLGQDRRLLGGVEQLVLAQHDAGALGGLQRLLGLLLGQPQCPYALDLNHLGPP